MGSKRRTCRVETRRDEQSGIWALMLIRIQLGFVPKHTHHSVYGYGLNSGCTDYLVLQFCFLSLPGYQRQPKFFDPPPVEIWLLTYLHWAKRKWNWSCLKPSPAAEPRPGQLQDGTDRNHNPNANNTKPNHTNRVCAVTRRFSDNDSWPFCFPVPTKTLSYDSCVTISLSPFIKCYYLDTCGVCNN